MKIIAALTKNHVIGNKNKLIWNIPEDLKNFKKLTSGNSIIMGRRTFESIGRALPNRHNIVVSQTMEPADGVDVVGTPEEAVALARNYGKEIFIIGGGTIYQQFINIVSEMHLSYVKKEYPGDAFFPQFDESQWDVVEEKAFDDFDYKVFRRKP